MLKLRQPNSESKKSLQRPQPKSKESLLRHKKATNFDLNVLTALLSNTTTQSTGFGNELLSRNSTTRQSSTTMKMKSRNALLSPTSNALVAPLSPTKLSKKRAARYTTNMNESSLGIGATAATLQSDASSTQRRTTLNMSSLFHEFNVLNIPTGAPDEHIQAIHEESKAENLNSPTDISLRVSDCPTVMQPQRHFTGRVQKMRNQIRQSRVIKTEPEDLTVLKVVVQKSDKMTLQSYCKHILKRLVVGLGDRVDIHGYGKENVQGVEKVIWDLGKWVTVLKIETGQGTDNRYIIVSLRRAVGFKQSYGLAKERAKEEIKRRKLRAQLQLYKEEPEGYLLI